MENPTMRHDNESPVISIGDWIITLFITAIPIVGLVMLFVWGFGAGTNPTKANFAKATLVLMLIGFVLWFLFIGAIVTAILSAGYEQ